MQAEVSRAGPDKELGGLLIRSRRSEAGAIRIVDFIPLAPPAAQSRFQLPSDSLAETIARCPSDYTIAGYYRTDIERRIALRAEDKETMRNWFRAPANICLVIAPEEPDRSMAGFFCWEDQAIGPESHLLFPFSVHKLSDPKWPKQGDLKKKRTIFAAWANSYASFQKAIREASALKIAGVVSLLLVLAIGIRIALWYVPHPGPKIAQSSNFALTVQKRGANYLLRWNSSTPEISEAKEADVVVWDAGMTDAHGNIKPIYIRLARAQLHLGSFVYNPISLSERIKFRLEIMDPAGNWLSESVTAVGPAFATGEETSKP